MIKGQNMKNKNPATLFPIGLISLPLFATAPALAAPAVEQSTLPIVSAIDLQPLSAQVNRLVEALDYLGAPLSSAEKQSLQTAMAKSAPGTATEEIQRILDPHCLISLNINPEMRVKVA